MAEKIDGFERPANALIWIMHMQWSFLSVPDLFNYDYADLSGGADPAIAAVFSENYAKNLVAAQNWQLGGPNSMNATLAGILHQVVDDMVATTGSDPELVMIAGDLTGGRWPQNQDALKLLFGNANTPLDQELRAAAESYYSWVRTLFRESGVDKVVAALGDHDIGDNNWKVGSAKAQSVPTMKSAFSDALVAPLFAGLSSSEKAANDPWADIRFDPGDTSGTNFVFQQNNVLFLTVDMFRFEGADIKLGPNGAVKLEFTKEDIAWIQQVLERAEGDVSVEHVIIQGHSPVLGPVKSSRSSALTLKRAEFSAFWQTIEDFGTDNGGKVRAFLNGEVHATTTILDEASGIVQIAHGALIEPSRRKPDDLTYLAVDVEENRLTFKEYKAELSRVNDTSFVWQVDRPNVVAHDTYTGTPVLIGETVLDVSAGSLDLAASGSLEIAVTVSSRKAFAQSQEELARFIALFEDRGIITLRDVAGNLDIDASRVTGPTDGAALRTQVPDTASDTLLILVVPGSEGNDRIFGANQRDILDGGRGLDRLVGQGEADVFVFRPETGLDTVYDFTDNEDRIFLDGIAFDDLTISAYRGDDTLLQAGADRIILRDFNYENFNKNDIADSENWFLT